MLGKLLSRLLGGDQARHGESAQFLGGLRISLERDFSFLASNYGFFVAHEEYVGRGACFVILENELMRLRVESGGEFGGYDWCVGDRDAEKVFEKGGSWVDLLRFVNDKCGANERLPNLGQNSWDPIPRDVLRETYGRVLEAKIADIMRLFETFGRIALMPNQPADVPKG